MVSNCPFFQPILVKYVIGKYHTQLRNCYSMCRKNLYVAYLSYAVLYLKIERTANILAPY